MSKALATSVARQNMASSNTKKSSHTSTTLTRENTSVPTNVTSVAVMKKIIEYVSSQEVNSTPSPAPIILSCSLNLSCLSCTSARMMKMHSQLNTMMSMRPMNGPMKLAKLLTV